MTSRNQEKILEDSPDFSGEIPVPSAMGVKGSLEILRRSHSQDPLDAKSVSHRLDLLLTPFARLIHPFDKRAALFKQAVEMACGELPIDERIAIEEVLISPVNVQVKERRENALVRLRELGVADGVDTLRKVSQIEDRALLHLAGKLTSESFAKTFSKSEQLPISVKTPRPAPVSPTGLVRRHHCWSMEFDDNDPRKCVVYQAVAVRVVGRTQRVLEVHYYTTGSELEPHILDVLSEDEGHTRVATKPDVGDGRPLSSWIHFFHLGRALVDGDPATLRWREEYFDKERTMKPHLALVAHPGMQSIALAIKLPRSYAHQSGEARVIRDPFQRRDVLKRWACPKHESGWYGEHFTNLEPGLEYGVFFPGLQFYK